MASGALVRVPVESEKVARRSSALALSMEDAEVSFKYQLASS